jgi:predicted metal-dependent enzyme (double-stranded beta helix superfamily)
MVQGFVQKVTAHTPMDWTVGGDNQVHKSKPASSTVNRPYRLYHFLSDVDRILEVHQDSWPIMNGVLPLVRRLVGQENWLDAAYLQPDPEGPWAVYTLFDAPGYALTVQTVIWSPGQSFPPHNHAGWGIVAIVSGIEENTLWQRTDSSSGEGPAHLVTDKHLQFQTGDIVAFDSQVIHSVRVPDNTPTATFNIYGPAELDARLEYDLDDRTAHLF